MSVLSFTVDIVGVRNTVKRGLLRSHKRRVVVTGTVISQRKVNEILPRLFLAPESKRFGRQTSFRPGIEFSVRLRCLQHTVDVHLRCSPGNWSRPDSGDSDVVPRVRTSGRRYKGGPVLPVTGRVRVLPLDSREVLCYPGSRIRTW